MPDIEDVKAYLARGGVEVWQYEQSTPTAELAAVAVGCCAAEIAKSLLFFVGGKPLLVVTCGDMKVKSSLLKLEAKLSGKVKLPEPEEVKSITGYAPGGVCPFLLPAQLPVFLDRSLCRYDQVYTAAGDAGSAVPIAPVQLAELSAGRWVDVCVKRG